MHKTLLVIASVVLPQLAQAQVVDSTTASSIATLRPVSVSTTRSGSRTPLELPFAMSRVSPEASRPGLRRNSVGELLLGVPGVQVQDRSNPSQDARLSIRGFGSRSAFGVRGVRVLRDGIPLTLPDGQTPLDWLDLESVGEIEVIRGTAAALFGNAAGGVVSFRTREIPAAPISVNARAWNGAGLLRTSGLVTARAADSTGWLRSPGLLLSLTRTAGSGAREYSEQQATSLFTNAQARAGTVRLELTGGYYDNARADNTGALTADELARDPELPDPLNVSKRSRKAVRQSHVALAATHDAGANEVAASLFGSTRSLDNPLPFSVVGVERRVAGGSLRGGRRFQNSSGGVSLRLSAGLDAQWQQDDRSNWENCADRDQAAPPNATCPVAGAERGSVRLDQREDVDGFGSYVRAEFEFPARVFVSGALRHDQVRFDVADKFITGENADDSGERTMNASSPMAGIVWRVRPLVSLYANWSRAFETPTITELTNQPDGAAGLNSIIAPQRTRTIEAGVQGIVANVAGDVSVYDASVVDELVSFDVPNAPGRRAFRNAGRTLRRGIEASLRTTLAGLELGSAYTYSHFRFVEYVVGENSFAGNPIPGVPEHQWQGYGTQRLGSAYATVEARMSSRLSANDAATVFAAGYTLWNVRAGSELSVGATRLDVFGGVENLFDRRYASSVVTNATRGRFYEPGTGRRAFVGVGVGFH